MVPRLDLNELTLMSWGYFMLDRSLRYETYRSRAKACFRNATREWSRVVRGRTEEYRTRS